MHDFRRRGRQQRRHLRAGLEGQLGRHAGARNMLGHHAELMLHRRELADRLSEPNLVIAVLARVMPNRRSIAPAMAAAWIAALKTATWPPLLPIGAVTAVCGQRSVADRLPCTPVGVRSALAQSRCTVGSSNWITSMDRCDSAYKPSKSTSYKRNGGRRRIENKASTLVNTLFSASRPDRFLQ